MARLAAGKRNVGWWQGNWEAAAEFRSLEKLCFWKERFQKFWFHDQNRHEPVLQEMNTMPIGCDNRRQWQGRVADDRRWWGWWRQWHEVKHSNGRWLINFLLIHWSERWTGGSVSGGTTRGDSRGDMKVWRHQEARQPLTGGPVAGKCQSPQIARMGWLLSWWQNRGTSW